MLVNNAGIATEWTDSNVVIGAADLTAGLMRQTFETNVFGTVRVLHAFLPLLERSTAPVVVNVSSSLASLTRVTTPGTPAYAYPGVAYPASKAAVNMITAQYAKAFPNMRINAVEPGFTKTDLNGNNGLQTVEQGAEIIVRMAQVGSDGPTGATSTPKAPFPGDTPYRSAALPTELQARARPLIRRALWDVGPRDSNPRRVRAGPPSPLNYPRGDPPTGSVAMGLSATGRVLIKKGTDTGRS